MSTAWAIPGLLAWVIVLCLPWRPWATRERLEARGRDETTDLGDITVLIPARDEARSLPRTLASLRRQGHGLKIVVVDDQSTDGTAAAVRALDVPGLELVSGAPLRPGWSGKVWAQSQGERELDRPLTLLLDADIELAPGLLATLREELGARRAGLVSLMAELPMRGTWERLLLPAFVYFFKLLYPFALANRVGSRVAAAAGGCVLLETRALRDIGGFAVLRDALIDDCTLAALVKRKGYPTWIGLTRSVTSHRRYRGLGDIWRMVTRTAFTELRYSWARLAACTLLMVTAFLTPLAALLACDVTGRLLTGAALIAMALSYMPTLSFYGLPRLWALSLPIAASLFLTMTWHSALQYSRGERSAWRGRRYARVGP